MDLDAVVVNAVTRKVELDFAHVRFYRKFSFHVINYSTYVYISLAIFHRPSCVGREDV